MNEILFFVIACISSFVLLVASFVYFNKYKTGFKKYIPYAALLLFIITLSFTSYYFLKKGFSLVKFSAVTYKKKGETIYKSIFGNEALGCVTTIQQQDQIIP